MELSILFLICDADQSNAIFTKKCFESLLFLIELNSNIELVVVDNGSMCRNTLREVENHNHPRMKYFKLSYNTGIVNGFNYAANLSNGNYLTFCHSDCLGSSNTFTEILNCFHENKKAGIVLSKMYYPND